MEDLGICDFLNKENHDKYINDIGKSFIARKNSEFYGCTSTKQISKELKIDYEKAKEEQKVIISKKKNVENNINEAKIKLEKHRKETLDNQKEIINSDEKIRNEGDKLIENLKNCINYQEETNDFLNDAG